MTTLPSPHRPHALGRTLATLALAASALLAALPTAAAQDAAPVGGACTTDRVATPAGAVCGRLVPAGSGEARAFLGIPYAESTAGANRFRAPVPKSAWDGVFEATAFGPLCPQTDAGARSVGVDALPRSEDCLSLNVWTPPDASPERPYPVLVWIHGGAFTTDGSANSVYDGARLAAGQNLVVVSLNYRLGALGFLYGLPGVDGNAAMLDQRLALEWVRDTIGAFGGDPDGVTLAGESAGAMSVGLHLLSMPSSEGLFDAAVIESFPAGLPLKNEQQARRLADTFASSLGCRLRLDILGCLQNAPLDRVLQAQGNGLLQLAVLRGGLSAFLTWAPVLDGEVVVEQPLAAALGGGIDTPVLIGTNAHEGTVFFSGPLGGEGEAAPMGDFAYRTLISLLFTSDRYGAIAGRYPASGGDNADRAIDVATDYLFTCANLALATSETSAPVYYYRFEQVPAHNDWSTVPRCAEESCHGAELRYVFGNPPPPGFTPEEEALAATMGRYWGRFAGFFHNPSVANAVDPVWDPIAEGVGMRLVGGGVAQLPLGDLVDPEVCGFWDGVGYDLDLAGRLAAD